MSTFKSILPCLVALTALVNFVSAEENHPDIVFIIVDDLNDWVGCLGGHPDAKSPNIDGLAASGMLFSQGYCHSPQCRPSRTSLNWLRYHLMVKAILRFGPSDGVTSVTKTAAKNSMITPLIHTNSQILRMIKR